MHGLEKNCVLRGTDNVQGQISEHIFTTNGGYRFYSPSILFSQHAQFLKLGNIETLASIWRENMLVYLSANNICFKKRTAFRERSLKKTLRLEEQITSKDKYPSMFSPQMEAIAFIILQILFAARAILKIG